jgi:hypothetical protein
VSLLLVGPAMPIQSQMHDLAGRGFSLLPKFGLHLADCRTSYNGGVFEIKKENQMRGLLGSTAALLFTGLAFLGTMSAFGQTANDLWLILASGEKGSINVHTTREVLVRAYGASNVTDQDAHVGEGEIQLLTVLFKGDPQRRIELLWKDPGKTEPAFATIRGKVSRWHAAYGISLGTTLPELERINGRPFRFALTNDGTDMAEEHISWQGGQLEKDFQGDGRITLSLVSPPTKEATQTGPSDFGGDSNEPAMRRRNLYVDSIAWEFPSHTKQ